jgi:ethanolamine ammonia-lyase large subunit
MKKAVKEFLEDKFVEDRTTDIPIWSMITKTSKITFLDQNEVSIFESLLEAMICRYMMSIPPCVINDDTLQLIDQVRVVSKFNLRRSSGTENANKINERTVQAMQIRQSFTSGGGISGSPQQPGFLKRLFGVR